MPGVVGDEAVRATAIASVLGGSVALDDVFRDLARVLPANVWLTNLSPLPSRGSLGRSRPRRCRRRPRTGGGPAHRGLDRRLHVHASRMSLGLLARLATLPSLSETLTR